MKSISIDLTPDQQQKLVSWQNSLPPAETGAIGGRIEYILIPTGLGLIIKVRDSVTKSEVDLTEYGDW